MPKSGNKAYMRGNVVRTIICSICDKSYKGDFKTVNKLMDLHVKKEHNEIDSKKPNPNPKTSESSFVDNYYSKKNNKKREEDIKTLRTYLQEVFN